jgi:hypothetical protein
MPRHPARSPAPCQVRRAVSRISLPLPPHPSAAPRAMPCAFSSAASSSSFCSTDFPANCILWPARPRRSPRRDWAGRGGRRGPPASGAAGQKGPPPTRRPQGWRWAATRRAPPSALREGGGHCLGGSGDSESEVALPFILLKHTEKPKVTLLKSVFLWDPFIVEICNNGWNEMDGQGPCLMHLSLICVPL